MSVSDQLSAFIQAACVPREGSHSSGDLSEAERLLSQNPDLAKGSIYSAAVVGDEEAVRAAIAANPLASSEKGGPYDWDALTYLCFSRYLRLDKGRSKAFVETARVLLDSGASANTGWIEMIDHPNPRPILESAIYGAAGVAQNSDLTRLLLDRGADPNDEETPYHLPESYDNSTLEVVLESGKLNRESLACVLHRKSDWHDLAGVKLALKYGADPNLQLKWGSAALNQALRRDNSIEIIRLLLDHGADPTLKSNREGLSAIAVAAHRGRGDVLRMFEERGISIRMDGVFQIIAACALGEMPESDVPLPPGLMAFGGMLLAEFAGNDNLDGVKCLLKLGIPPGAVHGLGDGYFDITRDSSALHVAAWRAAPRCLKQLVESGAPVNALDSKGRTPLQLAIKACVDSYWTYRRSPDSVEVLLKAGASAQGVKIPTGYEAVDEVLRREDIFRR